MVKLELTVIQNLLYNLQKIILKMKSFLMEIVLKLFYYHNVQQFVIKIQHFLHQWFHNKKIVVPLSVTTVGFNIDQKRFVINNNIVSTLNNTNDDGPSNEEIILNLIEIKLEDIGQGLAADIIEAVFSFIQNVKKFCEALKLGIINFDNGLKAGIANFQNRINQIRAQLRQIHPPNFQNKINQIKAQLGQIHPPQFHFSPPPPPRFQFPRRRWR